MLTVAVQMDAIESIKFEADTSFVLALEAQNRGHKILYYQPHDMFLKNGEVFARLQDVKLFDNKNSYFELGDVSVARLDSVDVVLMRQDPPFDMNYLTYTYMLDKISANTLVVNNPTQVRNCPEKLFVCDFPDFTPPTVISADLNAIKDFYQEHGQVVLKPLYGHGGNDIVKIDENESDFDNIVRKMLAKQCTPIIAQKFIAAVTKGDKRITLLDGEVVGAVNRLPEGGSILSNFAQGGVGEKTELTKREQEICAVLGPQLKKRDLILVGIDVIDGYLTEINVTSPTGIKSINRLDGVKIEAEFWDVIEGRV